MKLALIILSLLLLVFSDTNYQLDYLQLNEKCGDAEDNKDQCLSVNLNNNAYQCCMITITTTNSDRDDEKSSSCTISISDTSLLTKVYNDAMFKAQIREIFGYLKYGLYFIDEDGEKDYLDDESTFKFSEYYECKDGTAEYKFGYETYSKEDLAIFDSGAHCLKYFYRYLYPENYDEEGNLNTVSKSDCQNGKLTEAASEAGVKCGFYQFKINFLTGSSKTYQTCYLYNSNIINNGKLDEKTQSEISSMIMHVAYEDGGMYSTYTTEFTDESGTTYTFDMTGAISKQYSSLLKVSKYLIIMIALIML